jgi:hypothetical protein
MTKMQSIQAADHRPRRRRSGPALIVAALVAVLSMALAAPALAAEPPNVTNMMPREGTSAGGTSVTIIGTNLSGATAVKFGETNAASFTVNSNRMITAVSPPQGVPTIVSVTVTTPAGMSALHEADVWHYLQPCQEGHAPAITSLEPHEGPAGTSVRIKGERLFNTVVCTEEHFSVERVLFGFTEVRSFERPKEDEIVAVAPPGTGTVDVTVESGLGQSPTTPGDHFTNPAPPPQAGHYYANGLKIAEGSKRTVIGWGTITLAGVKGGTLPNHVTCHTAAGGTVGNPVGGGAGVGATEVFGAYQCESENICPAPLVAKATAEKIGNGVGWPSVLTEPSVGVFSPEISKVKLEIACFNPVELEKREGEGEHFVEIGGYGTETPGLGLKPEAHKGSSAAHPGGDVFGPGSGELEGERAGGALTFKTEGELKILGFSSQEIINVKE